MKCSLCGSRGSRSSDAERQRISDGQHPTLVHLRPDCFPDLPEENAAMIAGLVRVHRSAMDDTICGRLDEDDMATVHERLVRFHGLSVRRLVEDRLKELAAAQAARRAP